MTMNKLIKLIVMAIVLGLSLSARQAWSKSADGQSSNNNSDELAEAMGRLQLSPAEKARIFYTKKKRQEYRSRILKDPDNVGPIFADILVAMKRDFHKQNNFPYRLGEFKDIVNICNIYKISIPRDVRDNAAKTLLEFYKKRRKHIYLLEFPIEYSNVPEVEQSVLEALVQGTDSEKVRVLRALWAGNQFVGNQRVSRRVLDVYNKSGEKNIQSLSTLSKLDPNSAMSILKKRIVETKDVKEFNKLADIISSMRNSDALELILRRVDDFPRTALDSNFNPTIGIYPEVLLDYIKEAEDQKLVIALHVLLRDASARVHCYPVLIRKLESKNPQSKIAVLDCLRQLFASGDFVHKESEAVLEKLSTSDSNSSVREAAKRTLEDLRNRLGERK